MFKIHAVQAKFGDCLILEWGRANAPKYMLVDGGPATVYTNHLKDALASIVGTKRLEAVVLSHVDTDHVSGLLDLFAELEARAPADRSLAINELWHNTFGDTIDVNNTILPRLKTMFMNANVAASMDHKAMELLGVAQGETLRRLALQLSIPINTIADPTITVEALPGEHELKGLKLTIVGPTEEGLVKLRQEWQDWLDKNEAHIATADTRTLANSDRSGPNISSICFVAEANGRRILLTGDARSDFLLDGLEAQGLLDAYGSAHFDILKVMHHGSDRNATRTFFSKITADKYLISADGKHGNPDLPTLIWIVEEANEQGREIQLLLTNETDSVRALRRSHPPAEFGYTLRILPSDEAWLTEQLA